jgi:flagellum-specific peptidoglycan hydrolase FlgJ
MNSKDFTRTYIPFARATQTKTGISAIAILAQAALESGWGEHAPGNMFFGVKDTDGVNGNEQLVVTTEYLRTANAKFPEIISIAPVVLNGQKYFKYVVKDYFRKYDSPEESFTDHASFFLKNGIYGEALKVKSDPYAFIDAIAKAGYATDPNYAAVLKDIAKGIENIIKILNV